MRVSLITASYNSVATIRDSLDSVLSQDYPHIEHIVIDGASTDGTVAAVRTYGNRIARFISEPDQGMYDAMNKGIRQATGDIVGILNSDDFYASPGVISRVVQQLQTPEVDCTFGDLVYVSPANLRKVVRYYSSAHFHPRLFAYGWMPAHPTVFIKRWAYEAYGLFKTDYQIAADYELLTRFLGKHHLAYRYIPEVMVHMRTGGVSTVSLKSNWILNCEIVRGCRENDISTNLLKVGSKYFTKVTQLIRRPTPA